LIGVMHTVQRNFLASDLSFLDEYRKKLRSEARKLR
jgi:hypothetical protein